jgi:hypothetical protein
MQQTYAMTNSGGGTADRSSGAEIYLLRARIRSALDTRVASAIASATNLRATDTKAVSRSESNRDRFRARIRKK